MTVSSPIPFSISNISSIGAQSPHNNQGAVPLHIMARTTRLMDTGGVRTDTIPISGGPIPFSSSHGHRRRHLLLDKISRRDLGKADDLGRCDGQLPSHTVPALCEFCAASFRLKNIEGQGLESDITRRRNALACHFAAHGGLSCPFNPSCRRFHGS